MSNKDILKCGESSFGETAEKFLRTLYERADAKTTLDKIRILQGILGGESNFYSLGGELTDEKKLAFLEFEILEKNGVIKLTFA